MNKSTLTAGALALLLCGMAGNALAHNPVSQCEEDGDDIVCTGGFSDGSGAPGVTMDVIDYDENVLVLGKLDDDSTLRFKRPDSEFYVLFDAGPGHVVEIDYTDIAAQ